MLEELVKQYYNPDIHNFEIQHFDFNKFREVADTESNIDLANNIIIVKRVQMLVTSNTLNWTDATSFVILKSKNVNYDYSSLFQVDELSNGLFLISSEVPSVHHSWLRISYDLTTFFTNAKANILKASVVYAELSPKSKR